MLLEVPKQLPPGCILNASVMSAHAMEQPLELVCEVRWQEFNTHSHAWLTGVQVLDSHGSDIDHWNRIITLMRNPDAVLPS